MKRTLSLKKESLAELTSDELSGVVAGTHTVPVLPYTIILTICHLTD